MKKYEEEIKKAIFIRRFETRLLRLFSEGRINGTVHTCVGEELNPVFLCKYIQDGDYFLSNHRGHGHFIARTGLVYELMAEMMGRTSGISHGYGGSQHLLTDGFISNGVQGGMTPVAAGIGLSFKLDNKKNIAVSFLGDGTMGQGLVYESFNVAAKWNLPVLYVLENNHYAQSTCKEQTMSGTPEDRAKGFGLAYFHTDIWNLDSMDETCKAAIDSARNGKATLLEIDCYRLNSHSKGDDNRKVDEVEAYKQKDIINQYAKQYPEAYEQIVQDVETYLDQIIADIDKDPVLSEVPNPSFLLNESYKVAPYTNDVKLRGGECIHQALKEYFAENQRAVLLGEDVEYQTEYTGVPYGGAFKVTKDMSILYKGRVRNTPIAEQVIMGISNGLAFMGYTAFAEIMFGDFMTLTLDQLLQHASKFSQMYGRNVKMPLIVRTPMGGRRGYGPTHSQSIEKHFFGIPNIDVLAINNAINPKDVYKILLNSVEKPTLVIENKVLYTHIGFPVKKGFKLLATDEKYPTAIYRPGSSVTHVTIACYGGMMEVAKEAAEVLIEEDIVCEVVSPTMITPLNIAPIADSVNKTHRILIVEEGSNFASWGSEVCAGLFENGVQVSKVIRMGNNSVIPCSLPAENNLLVSVDAIVEQVKKML
jgi:2-oxoisovalerate dehydrogenase E1 component